MPVLLTIILNYKVLYKCEDLLCLFLCHYSTWKFLLWNALIRTLSSHLQEPSLQSIIQGTELTIALTSIQKRRPKMTLA